MPSQDSPKPNEQEWKFDFAGAYYYETSNRERHAMVRRHKTVWRERPLLWLSLGQGSVWPKGSRFGGNIKYSVEVPAAPVLHRLGRAYSDSAAAWMAGAMSGIFQGYLFMAHDTPEDAGRAHGVWVFIESIGMDIPVIDKAVEHVFAGIDSVYRLQAVEVPATPDAAVAVDDDIVEGIEEFFDTKADKEQALAQRIRADKERFRLGFFLEQKYVLDSARVMSGLPMPDDRSRVLWVSRNRRMPQLDWSGEYDLQPQLNELSWMDLPRYRFIGIAGMDDAPLRDDTILAVTSWLREYPGMLYVRGSLSVDETNQASTPGNHTGILQQRWQWQDCAAAAAGKRCGGCGHCQVLQGGQDAPELVLWRRQDMKGIVVFDRTPSGDVRERLNELCREFGVGVELDGTPGVKMVSFGGLTAAVASAGNFEPVRLQGVELFTGEPNPVVHPGRCAAIVAENYRGEYVASMNGVVVLGNGRLDSVEAIDGGIKVAGGGLLQAASIDGRVNVAGAGGFTLPAIDGESLVSWLLFGDDEGVATLPVGQEGAVVTYIRCNEAVVITRPERDSP